MALNHKVMTREHLRTYFIGVDYTITTDFVKNVSYYVIP